MLILERSFVISRKLEIGLHFLIAGLVSSVFGFILAGCIVIDAIDFEKEVNYPPEIIRYNPSKSIISICVDAETSYVVPDFQRFEVAVWDPDIEDPEDSQMAATLFLDYDPSPEVEDFRDVEICNDISKSKVDKSVRVQYGEKLETGIIVEFECILDRFHSLKEEASYPIEFLVSDRGYIKRDQVKESGHTDEITWIFEVNRCR